MKQCHLILVAVITCAVLLLSNNIIAAQEDDKSSPSESPGQQSPNPDGLEPIKGYPVRERRIGGPTDVERDLDNSFSKQGSILELISRCRENQPR